MSRVARVRLNPCDYLFWGQHRMNARKGEAGNIAFMLLDLEGDISPEWLQAALCATVQAHPVLLARFGATLFLGRPFWQMRSDIATAADSASQSALLVEDWRAADDWPSRLEAVSSVGNVSGWDLRRGPLVRLELYRLPQNRSRLIFRWPHPLMDAEGAQWFLNELTRCADGGDSANALPPGLRSDQDAIDPLGSFSSLGRWKLFKKGTSYQRSASKFRIRQMPPNPARGPTDHRVIHRNWTAEQTREMQAIAKQLSPVGPRLYARHLAACVVRAIHLLYSERGVDTGAYLITLPIRVGASDPANSLFARRPMIGNYLVSPLLCIAREHADDQKAVGKAIHAQLTDYLARRGDLLQWAMMWAASLIHAWAYELIFSLPFGGGRFSTGFSIYGEIDPPVRKIGGATVVNLWGGGPNVNPPALNPVFSRFGDRLNLTMTYTRPAVSDETAEEFVLLIERHMFFD
ncbi:MAG TPA: hypothetical protein VNT79_01830, partial [Phycisphaerae bacterium]|nr:hypothetical protein [Phycisphaerae bacterium]